MAEAADTQWRDGADLGVEGAGWIAVKSPYDRFPAKAKGVVPEGIWNLSQCSAGLSIRFITDSRTVKIRWSLTQSILAMHHMPSTGVSGVDLYFRDAKGEWRFVQNGAPQKQSDNVMTARLPAKDGERTECLVYLPLYNGVKKLEVGVPAGHLIDKAPQLPAANRLPIVYYGTSIAQGACASRPGMAFTAILGRALDRPVVNLGFSGTCCMQPSVTDLFSDLDAGVFVVDCLWNSWDLGESVFRERAMKLVANIRRTHPTTPIVFVGQSLVRTEDSPSPCEIMQSRIINELHDGNIHLIPGKDLIGADGEGSVDGCHPNDLGMMRQAEALTPLLRQWAKKRSP